MPTNDPPRTFPPRGIASGWRDWWDDDDVAEIRAHMAAADRRLALRAQELGWLWQREILAERRRGERERSRPQS